MAIAVERKLASPVEKPIIACLRIDAIINKIHSLALQDRRSGVHLPAGN